MQILQSAGADLLLSNTIKMDCYKNPNGTWHANPRYLKKIKRDLHNSIWLGEIRPNLATFHLQTLTLLYKKAKTKGIYYPKYYQIQDSFRNKQIFSNAKLFKQELQNYAKAISDKNFCIIMNYDPNMNRNFKFIENILPDNFRLLLDVQYELPKIKNQTKIFAASLNNIKVIRTNVEFT